MSKTLPNNTFFVTRLIFPGKWQDHCLIIVGDGGEADEVLALRRLRAGGRLVHFLVEDEQVKMLDLADGIGWIGLGAWK